MKKYAVAYRRSDNSVLLVVAVGESFLTTLDAERAGYTILWR